MPSNADYTSACICALPHELTACRATLDEEYADPQGLDPSDGNVYKAGKIGEHSIIIACLPAGNYGTAPAAAVVQDLKRSFPSVRWALMVGIGGGIPGTKEDIRLGDVVVSKPTATDSWRRTPL